MKNSGNISREKNRNESKKMETRTTQEQRSDERIRIYEKNDR